MGFSCGTDRSSGCDKDSELGEEFLKFPQAGGVARHIHPGCRRLKYGWGGIRDPALRCAPTNNGTEVTYESQANG